MTNELTDVRCPCGTEFPAESYDAGFIAGSGMCQNCDAALPPKDICTCPSGDGSLRHPCPAHPAPVEQAGGDERAAFEAWATHLPMDRQPLRPDLYMPQTQWAWEAWQFRAALAQPSPVRSSLLINGYQLRAALDFIAPDGTAEQLESEACIEWRQQDADFLEAGLYAFCAEYPEEGGVLLDEDPTTAQPSPLQSEQAEAERPEVVDFNPYRYHAEKIRQRADGAASAYEAGRSALGYMEDIAESALIVRNGLDELSAQHERIVEALRFERQQMDRAFTACINERDAANARLHEVATACATAEQERDAALARVAELEKQDLVDVPGPDEIHQMAFEEGQPADDGDGYLFSAEEFDLFVQRLLDSCAAPVAQAQHSGPEEFSFEYRHPNGESHTVTVSRDQVINEMPDFLFEALCSKFCNCEAVGETNVVECRCDEYAEEFKLIAAAPGNEGV
ncbi:TPA: hypothetical protein ACU6G2_001360 [Pseudomonas aeruginosa]